MVGIILLVVVLWLIWKNGCCIKRKLSGMLCLKCSGCSCKTCPVCEKKQTCEKCTVSDPDIECKCPPCVRYKCELEESFTEADKLRYTEGIDGTVRVVNTGSGNGEKPSVAIGSPGNNTTLPNSKVTVKVPTPPDCNCPLHQKNVYGTVPYTYYPIYQPLPYGIRY